MTIRVLITAILLTSTVVADAAPVTKRYRARHQFPVAAGGTFVLDNAVGNVEVVGYDGAQIEAVVTRTITGADDAAVEEGRKNTTFVVGGDERTRAFKTTLKNRTKEWAANVGWSVRVPKTLNVRIVAGVGESVRVRDVQGDISVQNVTGTIYLENVTAAASAESMNGAIVFSSTQPRRNARLSTIRGNITATVAATADFRWVADTLRGDIRTTFPARGAFRGTTFYGSINAPGGPTLTTVAPMGNIHLLAAGSAVQQAQSLKRPAPGSVVPPTVTGVASKPVQMPAPMRGTYRYETNLGDVRVPAINGDAEIFTGAGAVQLGLVTGKATVQSLGGPLEFGEVLGVLNASTRAGDILVDSLRRGGSLTTRGGTIRLLYTNGPTTLDTGGGDIVVRQSVGGPIKAETRSGDITITVDASAKTQQISGTTVKGNIVLHVPARFAADIDAVIETTDPETHQLLSDIPGLSISRQQIARGRTRIHATGKLNGGGEKIVLRVAEGDIRISTAAAAPTVVAPR